MNERQTHILQAVEKAFEQQMLGHGRIPDMGRADYATWHELTTFCPSIADYLPGCVEMNGIPIGMTPDEPPGTIRLFCNDVEVCVVML